MKANIQNLYNNGLSGITPSIGVSGVLKAVNNGWITIGDAIEIIGEDSTIDVIRSAKLDEISRACNSAIVSGVDLDFEGGVVHFNLSIEDQSNIANLFRVVELGGSEFPYQADGGVCRIYSAQEIVQIYIAAQTAITSQTTYHNALKEYVNSLTDVEKISAVQYGMTLPKKYKDEVAKKLKVAQDQMSSIIERINSAQADVAGDA